MINLLTFSPFLGGSLREEEPRSALVLDFDPLNVDVDVEDGVLGGSSVFFFCTGAFTLEPGGLGDDDFRGVDPGFGLDEGGFAVAELGERERGRGRGLLRSTLLLLDLFGPYRSYCSYH